MKKSAIKTTTVLCIGLLICGAIVGYDFLARDPIVVQRVEPAASATPIPEIKLNINAATYEALLEIPGIGEVTARRILEYRDKYGALKYMEELQEIEGIGTKKYEAISPFLVLE